MQSFNRGPVHQWGWFSESRIPYCGLADEITDKKDSDRRDGYNGQRPHSLVLRLAGRSHADGLGLTAIAIGYATRRSAAETTSQNI